MLVCKRTPSFVLLQPSFLCVDFKNMGVMVLGSSVLCSLCEGTVQSHDVHKKLTGIAHSVLERLPAGSQLRGDGC